MNLKMHFYASKELYKGIIVAACAGIILSSCEKFVAISPPPTQITFADVFNDDQSAISAMDGIYSSLVSGHDFLSGGQMGVYVTGGFSSDELINFQTTQDIQGFYINSLLPSNVVVKTGLWDPVYQYIFYANSILEGVQQSTQLSPAVKNQLTGEAMFVRGICYFYLLNLFGDVPLALTTDYRTNSILSRTAAATVSDQVTGDLTDAIALLADDYSFSNGERTRPNKWAATALLARHYLYRGEWVNAETTSTQVVNNAAFVLLPDLDSVFLANSEEAIWQLQPVQGGIDTQEGSLFITTAVPTIASLTSDFMSSFEPGDDRQAHWVGESFVDTATYYFPYKYKVAASSDLTEYSMVLRLAEQYLIRAEARAVQDKLDDAKSDLNAIRLRAGLAATSANDKSSLLLAIEQERRVELFSEGHRWLDLKRTNRADAVLGLIKGSHWQATDVLYPISQYDRTNDPNLSQNPGY